MEVFANEQDAENENGDRSLMLIAKELLHALWLNSDETVLLKLNSNREKSTPRSPVKDILNMQILTTKRLFILKYYYLARKVQITDSFYFDEITELTVSMQHYGQKRDPLFYLAITKRPLLSIKTSDKSYEISLRGVLFVKKNINRLVECVKKGNPNVNVVVNYKRDDLREAYAEILFDGIVPKKKTRLILLLILLLLILSIALWRVFLHLKTFTGY